MTADFKHYVKMRHHINLFKTITNSNSPLYELLKHKLLHVNVCFMFTATVCEPGCSYVPSPGAHGGGPESARGGGWRTASAAPHLLSARPPQHVRGHGERVARIRKVTRLHERDTETVAAIRHVTARREVIRRHFHNPESFDRSLAVNVLHSPHFWDT